MEDVAINMSCSTTHSAVRSHVRRVRELYHGWKEALHNKFAASCSASRGDREVLCILGGDWGNSAANIHTRQPSFAHCIIEIKGLYSVC